MLKAAFGVLLLIAISITFSVGNGSKALPQAGYRERWVHYPSGITFVIIRPGRFEMGSPADEPGRGKNERQHWRVIEHAFYLSETEVTVEQFRRFVEATNYMTDAERGVEEGGHTKGAFATVPGGDREWNSAASWRNPFPNLRNYRLRDNHPVVQVSWNDAKRFAEHYKLQLPTEAQWEYAGRGGKAGAYFWGNDEAGGKGFGNVNDQSAAKRFSHWNRSFAFDDGVALLAPVRSFKPNPWNVHDMVGNVAEWCEDVFHAEYPADGANESPAGNGNARVIRGGSWLDPPDLYRLAKRFAFAPQGRRDFLGFRVAMKAMAM
jgi:formylglycine-generating enzyme